LTENNERSKKGSKNKNKKRKISILRVLIVIILLLGFIGAGAGAGIVIATLKSVEPINPSKIDDLLNENSFILAADGELIEKIQSDGLREKVEYNQLPEDLINAFLAVEDKDFFEHKGINPKRIIKALWEDFKAGEPVQGASTITQQVAKNLYLTNEKTWTRKIKEAYYAFQLEKHLTKEQIFEAYLNTAYMGGGAKGVKAAAFTYFSKDLDELDLAEIALLAGVSKNPSRYSPLKTLYKEDVDPEKHYIINDEDEIYTIVYDERYKGRQQLVLKIMRNENMITEEEYQQALDEDLRDHLKPGIKQNNEISFYIVDQVKQDVVQALMNELGKSEEEALDMLYNQGLRIYSTIDMNIQRIVEKEYQNNKNFPNLVIKKDKAGNILNKTRSAILLYKYENLINSNDDLVLLKDDYRYDEAGNLILLSGKRLNFDPLYENGDIKGIQVLVKDIFKQKEGNELSIIKGGSVKIPSQYKKVDDKKNLVVDKEFLSSNPDFFKKDANEDLLINKDNYSISQSEAVQPQSAMVIIDYRTGEIKALTGGRDIKGRKLFNRAANPRQPGSSIKPLAVYTPAIDNGWTAADIVDDVPHYDNQGNLWPRNYYNDFWGLSTLREGIQWSMNVMAVKIVEKIGVSTSIDYLKKMGITTVSESGRYNDQNAAAMGLGGMTRGISPLEMTAAYGSLANQGVYVKPISFTKITDKDGNIILENTSYKNRVVSPEVSFIITDMMRSGVTAGTGQRAKLDKNNSVIPVAGKTGTTSDNYDAWFVGYSPYYVGGVWIGNDIQIELDSGSAMSAQLWNVIMSQVHKDLPSRNFDRPENVISVMIDTESGKLATDLSERDPRGSTVRSEYFVKGTEPKEFDDVHVELEIDTITNKLATPYCPPTLVERRVFIRRTVPYDPLQNNGIVPKDYIYEAPTEYCDTHSEFNNGLPIDGGYLPNPIPGNGLPIENPGQSVPEYPISEDIIDSTNN